MGSGDPDPIRPWLDDPWRVVRRATWTVGPGLVILFAALVVASELSPGEQGWRGLWERLRLVPASGGLLLLGASLLTAGFRWRELLPVTMSPPAAGLAAIQGAGTLLTYAAPGPVGEVGAAWLARRRYGVPLANGFAASFAGRILGVVTSGFLALGTWLAFDLPIPGTLRAPVGLVAVALGLGGVAGVAVAARPDVAHAIVSRVLRPLRDVPRLGRWVAAFDRGVEAGTAAIGDVARRGIAAWSRAAAWAVAGHLGVAGALALATMGVGAEPHVPGVLFTYAVITAGGVLLYAAPGSQVATDTVMIGLLVVTAGILLPDAIAATLLMRVQSFVVLFVAAAAVARGERAPAPPVEGG